MKCCPECLCTRFEIDDIHDEIVCSQCGLIVESPPCIDYVDAEPIRISRITWKTWNYILYTLMKKMKK